MDGASKFVRGDAIAGVIITAVNILGGFAIAMFQYGWSGAEALQVFGMLAIGDGLVSQIPSFIIAIAAGLIVARAGGSQHLGLEIPTQLASQPIALWLISGFLLMLSMTPLPTMPLLIAALTTSGVAWFRWKVEQGAAAEKESEARRDADSDRAQPRPVEDLLGVDLLELEVGYGLVRLVDVASGGDLLDRVAMIRRQLAAELGLVMPPVRIRDNMQLSADCYTIKIRGAVVADGEVHPNLVMAMDSGLATGTLDGIRGVEPAFGLEAIWIEPSMRQRAETSNYTVVDPTSVMATHLTEIVRRHAEELLSREEVGNLIEQLKEKAPRLVEETIPAQFKPGELQKVLQSLLREGVPVRDLETIVETLGDWVAHTRDPDVLVEYVRNALRRTICAVHAEPDENGVPRLHCVTMDPDVEDVLNGFIDRGAGGTTISVPPDIAARIARAVAASAAPLTNAGRGIIVVSSPTVRAPLRQVLSPHIAGVVVLGYNEIVDGLDVQSVGLVQLSEESNQPAPVASPPSGVPA